MIKVTDRPEYKVFHAMKQRCYNPSCVKYPDYGGRGIKICDKWLEPNGLGFINFIQDMGDRPEGYYSIERINVNGNYEPENCKWILMSEQTLNKRTTVVVKEGDVYGNLKVIKEVEGKDKCDKSKRRMFLCECKCGNKVIKRMDKLRNGTVVSCGLNPCNKYYNPTNKVEVL